MVRFLPVLLLALTWIPAQGQVITGLGTRWNDSFVEWELFGVADTTAADPEETQVGYFRQRWLDLRDDWSEWDYEYGTDRGTIKVKWRDNPSEWELRSFSGEVITLRTVWPRDFTEWRVTDNSVTLLWRSRYTTQLDEWQLRETDRGSFFLATFRERDTRDWVVTDKLDRSVSPAMRLALLFIAAFSSSPRF